MDGSATPVFYTNLVADVTSNIAMVGSFVANLN